MRIRLDQVRSEPFRWSESKQIPAATLERSEVVDLGEVHWRGEVSFASPGYRLRAQVSYEQTLECTRCLAPKVLQVDEPFEVLLLVKPEESRGGEHELTERDLGVIAVEEDEVELDPILLEQIQLNIPMRVVCREDCAGLCSQCGQNLNDGSCDCAAPTDPRWAALEGLRDELES